MLFTDQFNQEIPPHIGVDLLAEQAPFAGFRNGIVKLYVKGATPPKGPDLRILHSGTEMTIADIEKNFHGADLRTKGHLFGLAYETDFAGADATLRHVYDEGWVLLENGVLPECWDMQSAADFFNWSLGLPVGIGLNDFTKGFAVGRFEVWSAGGTMSKSALVY